MKGNSETPPFPVFPFSFFFLFFLIFLQNTEQMLRREGWLKKDVPKEQKTAEESACMFLGRCQDLKDQRGEKRPWSSSSHAGDRQWERGHPWAPYSGKEAHPSYPPKDL